MSVAVTFETVLHHNKAIILVRFKKDAGMIARLKQKFPGARWSQTYKAGMCPIQMLTLLHWASSLSWWAKMYWQKLPPKINRH